MLLASERPTYAIWIRDIGGHHTSYISGIRMQSHRYVIMRDGDIAVVFRRPEQLPYHVGFWTNIDKAITPTPITITAIYPPKEKS